MKKLWISLGILGALLAGAAIVLRAVLDPEVLGREAVRRINASGTIELEADQFRLDLLRGLSLIDARAKTVDGTATVTLDRLLLEHEPWPLVRGRLVVRRLLLERPRIDLVSGGRPPGDGSSRGGPGAVAPAETAAVETATAETAAGTPAASASGLRLEIAELRIEDGALSSRTAGAEPDLALEGLDLELAETTFDPAAGPGLVGLEAAGTLRADQLVSGAIVGRDAHGRIRIADGLLMLETVEVETDQGRLTLDDLRVALGEDPFDYRLRLAGDLDLDAILGAAEGGFGRLRLGLEAHGAGPESARLRGTGSLRFEAGRFAETPIIRAIEEAIGEIVLTGRSYRGAEVHYRIADDRIEIDPFDLVAEQAKLGSGGSVGLDGSLGLALHLHLPRSGLKVQELPRELLDALTGDDGFTALPLRVAGTFAAPSVALDREALERAAEGAIRRTLEREAGKLLRGLLGDDGDG